MQIISKAWRRSRAAFEQSCSTTRRAETHRVLVNNMTLCVHIVPSGVGIKTTTRCMLQFVQITDWRNSVTAATDVVAIYDRCKYVYTWHTCV